MVIDIFLIVLYSLKYPILGYFIGNVLAIFIVIKWKNFKNYLYVIYYNKYIKVLGVEDLYSNNRIYHFSLKYRKGLCFITYNKYLGREKNITSSIKIENSVKKIEISLALLKTRTYNIMFIGIMNKILASKLDKLIIKDPVEYTSKEIQGLKKNISIAELRKIKIENINA